MSFSDTKPSVHKQLLGANVTTPGAITVPRDDDAGVEVEFDAESGYRYLWVVPSVFLPCLAPLFALVARKNMANQKCTVTDRRVVFESGWLCHAHKSIPLDRIQDVNVRQDCVQACFGVKSLEIQTAGSGGSMQPEALLVAPVDAMMVRDLIMDRRDALVLGHPGAGSAPRGGAYDMAVVEELRAIRAALGRLETQVGAGFQCSRTSEPEPQIQVEV